MPVQIRVFQGELYNSTNSQPLISDRMYRNFDCVFFTQKAGLVLQTGSGCIFYSHRLYWEFTILRICIPFRNGKNLHFFYQLLFSNIFLQRKG